MSRILRVFPRKTNASPDDQDVRFGYPTFLDEADGILVSVTFTWDRQRGESLAKNWERVAKVWIGGPAYDDAGGEFEPGMFLKKGYVITSRGCPNHCWFCSVPKREGALRELAIKDGWNLLDNNLLACSRAHIEGVFDMLERQPERTRLTGGLEAARLEEWHVERIKRLNPKTVWFAYDTPSDWQPLRNAAELLSRYELITPAHSVRCYVLVGWKQDTFEKATERLEAVARLGIMPMAMLFDHGEHQTNRAEWIHFAKVWANPWVVGTRMKKLCGK